MPRYNRNFDLDIADIDLIEEALRARGRELSRMRLALVAQTPADLTPVRVIDEDLRRNEALLGRIHDQKVFYRPADRHYIGG